MRNKKLFLYLLLTVAAFVGIYFLSSQVTAEEAKLFIVRAGLWAPVLYVLILFSTYVVAPLSGTPVFFAGYLLFGKTVSIYNYFAAFLGVVINFWLARKFGRRVVEKLAGLENMKRIDRFTETYGVGSLIFLRIFQGHLHDFISFAYGLTNMRFVPYLIISALTPIPWFLLWYFYIFDRVESIGDLTFWLLLSVAPFYVISIFLFRYLKR